MCSFRLPPAIGPYTFTPYTYRRSLSHSRACFCAFLALAPNGASCPSHVRCAARLDQRSSHGGAAASRPHGGAAACLPAVPFASAARKSAHCRCRTARRQDARPRGWGRRRDSLLPKTPERPTTDEKAVARVPPSFFDLYREFFSSPGHAEPEAAHYMNIELTGHANTPCPRLGTRTVPVARPHS